MDPAGPRALPNAPARLSEIDYVAHDGPRSVAVGERETRQPELTEPRSDQRKVDESEGQTRSVHLCPPFSEADDPKRFGSVPVQPRGLAGVPPTLRKVTKRDPRPRPVRDGRHLLEGSVRGPEALLRLVEAAPLQQRAAQHEVRLADLVEEVLAPLEERERLACMLVRRLVVAEVLVHRREAPESLRGVRLRAGLDGECERGGEMLDRLLRVAEQELQPSEVEHQATLVPCVVELRVNLLRLQRVLPREHPVAGLLGDPGRLEVRAGDDAGVVDPERELERALRVLSRGLVVRLAPPAARAPREDAGAKEVAGEARALGELERLLEEPDRGGDARDPVAAAAEPEQHIGTVDVRELRQLRERARLLQNVDRVVGG